MLAPLLPFALAASLLVPQQDTAPLPGRLRWVPNPTRMAPDASGSTGWVSDPAHHLAPATIAAIDSTIFALERATGVEMAVVVLDSLDGLEPDQAALLLHRRWGVGKRDRNNGIVFLWSPALRATHVSIGYRLEGILPDARTGRIQDEVVLPAFRDGRFDDGILAGVRALAAAAREEDTATGVAAYNPVLGDDVRERPATPRRRTARHPLWWIGAIGSAIATLLAGVLAWRRRPRKCAKCRTAMQRLSESADDAELSPEERLEESLGSMNYDVWHCTSCGDLAVLPHRRWFSRYGKCVHCARRTSTSVTRTITPATQLSEGLAEVTTDCANCKAHDVRRKVIPRLPPPSSSSSSGGSSGFRGSGGGSSGSRSSFGGGSAGGGGAGRRY
jgi:uncharacterized protein